MGGDGGCRVGEVRAGTTSPMPDHKGFKLQQLVNFQKFSTFRVNNVSRKDTGFQNRYLEIRYNEWKADVFDYIRSTSRCQLFDAGDRLVLTASSTTKTTSCGWKLNARRELIINEFLYTGWDTLVYAGWETESIENTILKTHCQYGGLHIQYVYLEANNSWYTTTYTHYRTRYYNLCSNLTSSLSIPLKADKYHFANVFIYFSAYPGYSSGRFSIDYLCFNLM